MKNFTTKICEKCQQEFDCFASDIEKCHCYQVKLSSQELGFLGKNFKDCLCENCLRNLKAEFLNNYN